jgi:hypothetical protein
LAITLAESAAEKLLDPLPPLHSKFLETMLFLLNSDFSSRTFNFWISFAEASIDFGDNDQGDRWLQRALPFLLEKSSRREDIDHEELMGYRTDVVEVFEFICEALEYDTINSVVTNWLAAAASREQQDEKIVVSSRSLSIGNGSHWKLLYSS